MEVLMRLRDDGILDLDWRPPPPQTSQDIYDEILETVLRNNPKLTREEAVEMLALYI